jgi:hypothetical protein
MKFAARSRGDALMRLRANRCPWGTRSGSSGTRCSVNRLTQPLVAARPSGWRRSTSAHIAALRCDAATARSRGDAPMCLRAPSRGTVSGTRWVSQLAYIVAGGGTAFRLTTLCGVSASPRGTWQADQFQTLVHPSVPRAGRRVGRAYRFEWFRVEGVRSHHMLCSSDSGRRSCSKSPSASIVQESA